MLDKMNPWVKALVLACLLPFGAAFALIVVLFALAGAQGRSRG